VSRLVLGLQYPSDLAADALIGSLMANILLLFL